MIKAVREVVSGLGLNEILGLLEVEAADHFADGPDHVDLVYDNCLRPPGGLAKICSKSIKLEEDP